MGPYIGRRLLAAIPTLLALSLFIFVLVSLAPGDPAEQLARRQAFGRDVTEEDIARSRAELGLDRPFVEQFVSWVGGAATGDLGQSFTTNEKVSDELRRRIPPTLELSAAALLLTLALAVPLGVAAGMLHRHPVDHAVRLLALVGASVPGFFAAYLLIIVFATQLGLFPVAGRDGLDSLVLPAIALAVTPVARVSRLLRSSLLEVFTEDYMRTARGKGLSSLRVVVRHGLRNASIPVLTVLGGVLGNLLEGVVIVEVIFAWPGLGRLTYDAISHRDYPMIQGVVLFAGVSFFLVNLLVDLSYRLVDPRVRLGSTAP